MKNSKFKILALGLFNLTFLIFNCPAQERPITQLIQLRDVKVAGTPTDGDALVWDATLKRWTNGPITASGTVYSTNLSGQIPTNLLDATTNFIVAGSGVMITRNGSTNTIAASGGGS